MGKHGTEDQRAARLSVTDAAIIVGCTMMAALGFYSSFEAVSRSTHSWVTPIGIDLTILLSSAAYISLKRRDPKQVPRWLRAIPHLATGVTVYLNVTADGQLNQRVAHGALVMVWALFVEGASHVAKVRYNLASDKPKMDKIRKARWLASPGPTWLLWLRMVRWEIRSYEEALAHEQARKLLLMQRRYADNRELLQVKVMKKLGPAAAAELDISPLPEPTAPRRQSRTAAATKAPSRKAKSTVSPAVSQPSRPTLVQDVPGNEVDLTKGRLTAVSQSVETDRPRPIGADEDVVSYLRELLSGGWDLTTTTATEIIGAHRPISRATAGRHLKVARDANAAEATA
jgi:Protein of unknown function (DUF2637)